MNFLFFFFEYFFKFFPHFVEFVNEALSNTTLVVNLNFSLQFHFFPKFLIFFSEKNFQSRFFSNSTCYHDVLEKMNIRVHFQEFFLFSKFQFLFS